MDLRRYVAYPLSYRHVEELMEERGIELDHATVNRWVVKYSLSLEAKFRKFKKPCLPGSNFMLSQHNYV